jgi:hypothetical protein
MKRWSLARLAAAAVGAATLTMGAAAHAADCPAFTNPVYVTGSSASQPVLAAISGVLAAQSTPITLVYIKTESCQGVNTFTANPPTAVPAAATYWPSGTATSCNLTTPPYADASVSDVFAKTCGVTLVGTQKEYQGPVQAMTFIVNPGESSESSMSAEAARVILKYNNVSTYPIAPWTDTANIFIRPGGASGSGTRAMIGAAVGIADADWQGTLVKGATTGSADVLGAVATSAKPTQSLGILSVTVADNNRVGSTSTNQVKVLAFQAKGQECGYLPDSAAGVFDKLNVREGRYGIWGPLHFITAVNGSGNPVSTANPGTGDAAVQAFINMVTMPTGSTLTDAQKMSIIGAAATGHVVPQCAMRVRRTDEVGAEASYQPDEPCGCYWESKAGTASASCHACPGGDGDCASVSGAPKCRYGYCEAK